MIRNLLLFIVVMFVLFILGEYSVRLLITEPSLDLHKFRTKIYIEDQRYGWKFLPGNYTLSDPFRKEVMVTINPEGFREGTFKNNNNFENAKNIMFIGDSVTAGVQVSDHETFANLVQTQSGEKYLTYNFGVNGFSTDQAYLTLVDYKDQIKPHFVIYTFVINDLLGNLLDRITTANTSWGKPYFDEKGILHKKKIFEKTTIYINKA